MHKGGDPEKNRSVIVAKGASCNYIEVFCSLLSFVNGVIAKAIVLGLTFKT